MTQPRSIFPQDTWSEDTWSENTWSEDTWSVVLSVLLDSGVVLVNHNFYTTRICYVGHHVVPYDGVTVLF
jgi:hypothetical protein